MYHQMNARIYNELSRFLAERRATMGQKANSPLVDPFPNLMPSTIPTINLTRQQYEWHQDNYALLLTFVSIFTNTPVDEITVHTLTDHIESINSYVAGLANAIESRFGAYEREILSLKLRVEDLEPDEMDIDD